MNQYHKPTRLIRIIALVVILTGIIHSISPIQTAKAHHLYYRITSFYPTAEFPWVTWNLCNHPGGSFPYVAPPGHGYYEVDYRVRAGTVVVTSFSAPGGVAFSSSKGFTAHHSGLIADMLTAPAFSLPANTLFTVTVEVYQTKSSRKTGILLMRQNITLNCTTRVMTSNVITYH